VSDVRLPNVELLLSQFWRQDTIVASVFADNVYTELPAGYAGPWPAARITRVGGNADRLGVIDRPLIQVDVWGGPKALALEAADALRAAISQRLPWTLTGKGTLALNRLGTPRYVPDDTFDPSRPRYIFDATFITRP
jgi:hypothetical protein